MDTTVFHTSLRNFLSHGERISYSHKDTIVNVGFSKSDKYYWISSGFVKVVSYTTSGSERIHYIYGAEDIFPLGWLFAERPYQDVTFIAIGTVELIARPSQEFDTFIAEERFSLADVNRMLLNMHDRIYNLNLETAQERVAHSLLIMAMRHENSDDSLIAIPIPITQQQIADYVRSSRETVGKILSAMEEAGLITISRKKILVDKAELEKAVTAKLSVH